MDQGNKNKKFTIKQWKFISTEHGETPLIFFLIIIAYLCEVNIHVVLFYAQL